MPDGCVGEAGTQAASRQGCASRRYGGDQTRMSARLHTTALLGGSKTHTRTGCLAVLPEVEEGGAAGAVGGAPQVTGQPQLLCEAPGSAHPPGRRRCGGPGPRQCRDTWRLCRGVGGVGAHRFGKMSVRAATSRGTHRKSRCIAAFVTVTNGGQIRPVAAGSPPAGGRL